MLRMGRVNVLPTGIMDVRVVAPRSAAVAIPWWASGGATAVVAYQAKGVADYPASKVNLANPGTYNAAEGAAPNWNAATGWTFVPNDWLISCTHLTAPHFIIRITNGGSADRECVGCAQTGLVGLRPNYVSYVWAMQGYAWTYNNTYRWTPGVTAGVLALANNKVYLNGALKLTFGSATVNQNRAMWIGAQNGLYGGTYYSGDILAYAAYAAITEAQVQAVSAAMALL